MSKLSYLHNPVSVPYSYYTIGEYVKRRAEQDPDFVHFIERSLLGHRRTLTNQELYIKSIKIAKYLITKGVNKKDKVAIFGPDSLEWIVGEFGICLAGATAVHINTRDYDGSAIIEATERCGCRFLLTDPANVEGSHMLIRNFKHEILLLQENKHYQCPVLDVVIKHLEIDNFKPPSISPDDEAFICATSGSTGRYKLVSYTHFSVTCKIPLLPEKQNTKMKVYNDRPFIWITGAPVYRLLYGSQNVFLNTYFDSSQNDDLALRLESSLPPSPENSAKIWDIIKDEGCTDAYLSPHLVKDLINMKEIADEHFRLNMIVTSGEMIDYTYQQIIGQKCNFLCIAYGTSEISSITYKLVFEGETLETGEVGNITHRNEVRIVDDNDHLLPMGTIGNIQIRSRSLFKGYFGNDDLNKKVFTEAGWCRIGDKAVMNEDGSLKILGRQTDFICRDGRKIIPTAIEEKIRNISGIKAVAVIEVPDDRFSEEVCVCFVSETVSEEVVEKFCRNEFRKVSANDQAGDMPKYFLHIPELPIMHTGKLNKQQLKIMAI